MQREWEDVNKTPEEMASKVIVLELACPDILTEARNMVWFICLAYDVA